MNKEPKPIRENEIDLVELAKVIWAKRKFILKVTGIFFVLGLIIAFTSKVEYEASCKLMPESQEGIQSDLGGLGGLAGLAGINLDMGSNSILTPELYPEIVGSVPFQLDILNTPVYYETQDTTITSYRYFNEFDSPSIFDFLTKYTIGLPGILKSFFMKEVDTADLRSSDLVRLSKEDTKLIEDFNERVAVNVNSETGIISISVEMPDPYAAAAVAHQVVNQLTNEVTEYKIGKARINLEFIQERFEESKKAFGARQKELAAFTDRNKNLNSSLAQVEYQRLQNEYNIAFEVYKGLATQLEQAKIKVKEETPVFTVLEPVRVPVEKSKPMRIVILFVFIFVGVAISVFKILLEFLMNRS